MPRPNRCRVVAVWSPGRHLPPAVIAEEVRGGVRFCTYPDRVTPAQKEEAAAWWVGLSEGRTGHEEAWEAMWGS